MRPLGLYLHWPFCARICPYCDFTVARNRTVDEDAWTRVLLDDLRAFAETVERRPLRSVYFGGGTPSLMPFGAGAAVLAEAEALFGFEAGCEFTIEANPDDRARFAEWRDIGFSRLSLGVQSFDDDTLRFLGRNHDAKDAEEGLDAAVRVFDEVSLDLIYARPEQELGAWLSELRRAAASGVRHLSLYQLTVEPDTAFGRRAARGELLEMPDERAADFYEATQDLTADLGFPCYEVSNFAEPGHEAVHNALYWSDAEWVGIGPGAHGRIGGPETRSATETSRNIRAYPQLLRAERLFAEELDQAAVAIETIAGGLRPVAGFEMSRLGPFAKDVEAAAAPFIESGFLTLTDDRLAATLRGRLVLDQLASKLVSALPDTGPV